MLVPALLRARPLSSRAAWAPAYERVVDLSRQAVGEQQGLSLLDLSLAHHEESAKTQADLAQALRSNGVLRNDDVARCFANVDRALFIPLEQGKAVYAEPYVNKPCPLDPLSGAVLSTPHHHCLIAEAAMAFLLERPSQAERTVRMADLGCGTGYLVALMARLLETQGLVHPRQAAVQVLGTEAVPDLVDRAQEMLAKVLPAPLLEKTCVEHAFEGTAEVEELPLKRAVVEGGRFDLIHVGFSIPEASALHAHLLHECLEKDAARLIAPVKDTDGSEALVAIDKSLHSDGSTRFTKNILLHHVMCQPMRTERFDRAEAARSPQERLDQVKAALETWKASFEADNGRAPSKADMLGDPYAGALFRDFAALRKREWA